MYSKGIVALMLVLVFFIPGVYGISVIMSGEEGGNSFYDTVAFSALNHDSLMVHSAVNGATLLQDASGSGDLHKIFGASNHLGEKAQITADVVNAGSWEYTQPTIAADATTASVTGFTLTATDANSIKCNTGATDRLGDKASAAVEVYQGSLLNYHGDAFASSSGVTAMQSFDSAEGALVAVKERASNPTGSTITNTNVQNGGIIGYSNGGLTFANPQLLETVGQFGLADGKTISAESSAYKTPGSRSNTKMDVQNGQVFGYLSAAGVGFGMETGAQQILFGGANGNVIGLTASSSNAERDISSLKTDILGTETEPGFISGYGDLTESFRNSVFARNSFGQAGGNEIHLSSSASNRENDSANANMNAIGNGQITNYEGSSSATLKTATASNSNEFSGLAISENEINYDASASDAARNRASVNTLLLNGFIIDPLNSAAVDNTVIQSLTTNQGAYLASGSELEIDAMAINAAKLQKNLNTIYIPIGTGYGNFADVLAGNPEVLQSP
jgi:hypothetical protein